MKTSLLETAPRVSMILPTHNGMRYIDQSIRSVIQQRWQDWELIVVDDASTDGTAAMVDWWAGQDCRIRAVHLATNLKLPGALNEGFGQARGSLLSWTSDDNWFHPEALCRMIAVFDREPEVGVVYADSCVVDEYGCTIEYYNAGPPEELPLRNSIGACFLFRRNVFFELGGFDTELYGSEDYDFWLRAAVQFRFFRIPETLYFYRKHAGSLTMQEHNLVVRNAEKALRRALPHLMWPDKESRLEAYIQWGIRCMRADTWETVYEPWLLNVPWMDDNMRSRVRREVLKRVVGLIREACGRRDRKDLERYRGYLSEVKDDPDAARTIRRARIYPKWIYSAKDCAGMIYYKLRGLVNRGGLNRQAGVIKHLGKDV
jgi:glycosyltransferase involved in cell wall biosynthesis